METVPLLTSFLARSRTLTASASASKAPCNVALAAFLVLPTLEVSGFIPGQDNPPEAMRALTIAYAIIPCILKLFAMALVWMLPNEEPS